MDVVICGAGIVGLVMANLLARHDHLQIMVLDPVIPQLTWDPTYYDLRCSALAPATQEVLNALDVWQELLQHRAGVYKDMHVWDDELHNSIHFSAQDINFSHLGHIVENRVLLKILYNKLHTKSNVQILHDSAHDLHITQQYAELQLAAKSMRTKLLIAADGAKSWIRETLDIPLYAWDYKQSALVATVKTENPHANVALQRFTADGPLAFLPLAENNLCSIVWSAQPAKIAELMQMPAAEFNTKLAQEFSYKLGQVEIIGPRASFPLRLQHATEYIRPRVALIGDAAHVVHPLAGQGLNLGIADALCLYSELQQAMTLDADLGGYKFLRKYERQQRARNTTMLLGIDMLHRIFAKQTKSSNLIRQAGLLLCNNSNLFKNSVMRAASGLKVYNSSNIFVA